MHKTVLDTDIFSEILKKKHATVLHKAQSYRAIFGRYTISAITVMEIVKGFHKVQRESAISRFLGAISEAEVLTLDVQSAELAGRIYADLELTGQPIGRADPMVAGIALRYDIGLTTGNIQHYQRIQDLGYSLKLDNWKM